MDATRRLERYRHISRLGTGGSSMVILAEDTLLGRQVALKRIHAPDDVAARSRLRREALIGASLTHPNLVSIYDIVTTEDGEEVIVMEYVEGETLAKALRRGDRLPVPRVLDMLAGVSAALDAIHAQGVVHRDVKPANILLGVDGSVKLADLGIAAVPDRTHITTAGTVLGTFRYMAPEQLEGAVATPAVDVYALAAVAFEALSGQPARVEPSPLALAQAIATQPPPDLRKAWPQAPRAAAAVLTRALSREPRNRPRSAGELTGRLRASLESQPTAPAAAPVGEARRPVLLAAATPRRRLAGPLALAAALLTALAVAAIVLASSGGQQRHLGASHRSTNSLQAATRSSKRASTASSATRHASTAQRSASQPAAASDQSPASPSAAPAGLATGSPVSAVESFYHLAASHQYGAAWALADPSLRAQLAGFSGLQATMANERGITFNGANVVSQSPGSATVAVRTTSVRSDGTQTCSGTVNLLRAPAATRGWVLDHIQISCA